MPLLKIENLNIKYDDFFAVKNFNLILESNDSFGIIGESGSGKTSLAHSILGLLNNKKASISGNIYYDSKDITSLTEKEWKKYRFKKISLIFQNSNEVLNPLMTLKEQLLEVISEKETKNNIVHTLFSLVNLDYCFINYYPHQISGGMRQKFLIAMAIASNPDVLIADEPTTSLDPESKDEILKLLKKLRKELKFSLIVISHEIEVIKELTNKIIVMYKGHSLEEGTTQDIIYNPKHPYSRGLINSNLDINPYKDLWGIDNSEISQSTGCPFFNSCAQKIEMCRMYNPRLESISADRKIACYRKGIVKVLEAKGINKKFNHKDTLINACSNLHIEVNMGEIVVIIGKSGSGKTTFAEILSGVSPPDEGEIIFEGEKNSKKNLSSSLNGIQIVFQDPLSSTNENFTIRKTIEEPLIINKIGSKEENYKKIQNILFNVNLPKTDDFLNRKIHTLSGGQRQRIAIARALIMEPKLLIADEISSMLDSSTKANIFRLLKELQNKKGFSMIYITHDIPLAKKIADKVYVIDKGKIVKSGHPEGIIYLK